MFLKSTWSQRLALLRSPQRSRRSPSRDSHKRRSRSRSRSRSWSLQRHSKRGELMPDPQKGREIEHDSIQGQWLVYCFFRRQTLEWSKTGKAESRQANQELSTIKQAPQHPQGYYCSCPPSEFLPCLLPTFLLPYQVIPSTMFFFIIFILYTVFLFTFPFTGMSTQCSSDGVFLFLLLWSKKGL